MSWGFRVPLPDSTISADSDCMALVHTVPTDVHTWVTAGPVSRPSQTG
jgi:hypothetical protein